MNVGVNYAWPCNHWSSFVGLEQGKLDPGYEWRESLPRNFALLRRVGVSVVRIWLFANGAQYGNQPRLNKRRLRRHPASRDYEFDPPEEISQAYLDRIHFLCDSAESTGLKLIPVLFDFGVFAGLDTAVLNQNPGGGRVNIAINDDARQKFLSGTLDKIVDSFSAKQRNAILAFDAFNEPEWEIKHRSIREQELTFFLGECITHIEKNGLVSTVGHATASALCRLPAGQWPQLHYYPDPPGTFWAKVSRFRGIRLFDQRQTPPKHRTQIKGSFLGEFGGTTWNPWPECKGKDSYDNCAVYERLTTAAEFGYNLALLWPDGGKKVLEQSAEQDSLKFQEISLKQIKAFTSGVTISDLSSFLVEPFSKTP
jgi:hypothetical protein